MSFKIKVFIIILITILVVLGAGWLYYDDATKFDNKKQYIQAEQFYKDKNYQEAFVSFLRIRFFSKYRQISILKQALSAEKLGDWQIAINKYEKFLKISKPDSFSARAEYSLAKAYFMNKEYDKAVSAFINIKTNSPIQDYRFASDYFLGKISLEKDLITTAKKYYLSYIKNAPTGTYSLPIAFDTINMVLTDEESILVSKIFLANKKYDETFVVLKNVPKEKCWIYLAMANYYNKNYEKYRELTKEGFNKNATNIEKDDLINFTDFYLSLQNVQVNSISELQKTSLNKVIPDYIIYKKAQFLSEKNKIEEYKKIIKKYPSSEFIPDCLVSIFFDFAKNNQLNSAIRVGQIYLDKFSDTPQESQVLFWMGKYFQKLNKKTEAKKCFDKVQEKYPDSYYAFRASRAEQNIKTSWHFPKNMLPENYIVDFPLETFSEKDIPLVKLFLEVEDTTIWEEIPFENPVLRAWLEYKKGNIPRSVYLADKYIKESKKKIPYNHPVWKLAFPLYYIDVLNKNCRVKNLDSFLMLSLIREESHFNEKARSSSNALGLMQLLIPTATYIAEKEGLEQADEYKLQNPIYNITVGTTYFSHVLEITDNISMFAIGGYNGGPNAMNRWRKKYKNITDSDEFVENIPYAESKNYIKKVYRSRYNYSKIYE